MSIKNLKAITSSFRHTTKKSLFLDVTIFGRTNSFAKKIVVVNDNSTDKTEELFNGFRRKTFLDYS
jgi:glycosyltransferase involved in cell wall biosynthesis